MKGYYILSMLICRMLRYFVHFMQVSVLRSFGSQNLFCVSLLCGHKHVSSFD